jgi:hypothetical protein
MPKEIFMRVLRVLFVALCLILSSSAFADNSGPIGAGSPLVTSMYAEAYSLELVSVLPGPAEDPKSLKQLIAIADDYQEIAKDTLLFHSFSLRAVLPVSSEEKQLTLATLPPPKVSARKAVRFQEHALWLVNRLDSKIDKAYESSAINEEAYFELMDIQTSLREQISTLPTPVT